MIDYSQFFAYKNNEFGAFITHYEINNNTILIYNSNTIIATIDYSLENEQKILNIMKRQVILASFCRELIIDKCFQYKNNANYSLVASISLFLTSLFNYLINNYDVVVALYTFGAILSLVYAHLKNQKDNYELLITDLEKQVLFLENESTINKYLEEILKNSRAFKNDSHILTINDIHDLSYGEVSYIIEEANNYFKKTIL